ncbi:MAG: hypothetical protein M1436_09180 [Acidobacteria bacterium]|nr:hypothetical protein [Acidobacteriota bacterium]
MTDVITKAELARGLDLSRARISQLCGMGLPVRPDGKVNRAEAVAWVKANVCSWRGGWWGNLRQKGGRRAPMPAASMRGGVDLANPPEPGELPDLEIPDWEGELREAAVIDFMNEVRQTGNIESFARVALRFGCTMQQAYAMARWFDMFVAFYFVPKDPDRDYIRVHDEPDWNRIAADAGTTANVEEWRDWMNRLLEDGEPGKVEA